MAGNFIVFGAPDIQQPEIDEVVDSLKAGWLGTGPKVHRFEGDFAAYKGIDSSQVAAVNSCTAALHVSLVAAGIQPGDEVITTAMTFCATVNAIIHAGGTPVPVDIESDSLNIDTSLLETHITERTRAIVPVHFAGRPCKMESILALAKKYDLKIIEDCAHAIETKWRGVPAGRIGDFGCFSFYATKNVVTGEGGMVIANSPGAIDRIKILALHGMSRDAWRRFSDQGYKHYEVVEAGFKYNMMDIQAAVGIHQLARVEQAWQRRREIWSTYQEAFQDLPIGTPAEPDADTRHAYHLYTVTVDRDRCGLARDGFIDALAARGVGVGVHYLGLTQYPFYRERFGWSAESYPVAERYGATTVSLPLSPKLSAADVEQVIDSVRASVAG